ncbi:YtcA family lipoprotein [Acidisoma sp.]|uniref:YtcA family lipoprotein n=1 Tax=Acidisoma sp. TaxID=1872115 RepID=UPI003B000DF8
MVADLALVGGLSACSTAPAQDILGSFFPAWMLCAVIGIAAAVILRLVLGAVGLAAFVPLPALTFIAVAIAMTLLIWLIWFGH